MAFDDLTERHVHEVAVLVDHRVQRVAVTEPPHDLELFLVQRIADKVALHRKRILHKAGRVEGTDRFVMRHARCDHLPAAGPAGHEVRLDQTGGDAQLRLHETAVDPDRRAARRGAPEIDMHRVVARVMVLDPHVGHHPRIANQLGEFLALVRAMQAGGDQDRDGTERDAGGHHGLHHRPQEQPVRHRARDVADEDAGTLSGPCQLRQRGGADRPGERGRDGAAWVRQFRHLTLADDRGTGAGRDRDRQMALAEQQVDP